MSLQEKGQVIDRIQQRIDYLFRIRAQVERSLWESLPYEYLAQLNQQGQALFPGIFKNDQVPVREPISILAQFEDLQAKKKIFLVDLEALKKNDPAVLRQLLIRLAEIHGGEPEDLLSLFETEGLPLRYEIVYEIIFKWEQLEAEAPEVYEILKWWDNWL